MDDPFFSIIVPVYNSDKYLASAVESIVEQSFADWELLLIDDGSTDNSGKICNEFSAADSRIKTFHLVNGGMCHARNVALREATGTYVTFCDNDDHYLPGLLEAAHDFIRVNGGDIDCICYGRYLRQYAENGTLLYESEAVPSVRDVFYGEAIADNYDKVAYASDGVWCRCYRRGMLLANQIQFDESLRHGAEDFLFNMQVLSVARSIGLIPESYYEWLRREGHSASMSVSPDTIDGIDRALALEVSYLVAHGFDRTNPRAFSRRIVSQMPFQVVNVRRKEVKSLEIELPLYRMLRDVYSKYDHLITRKELLPVHRIEYSLLMGGYFRLLLWFVLFSGYVSKLAGIEKASS